MLHKPQRFIILFLVFCGCYPDLPIKYFVHSDWKPDEIQAIQNAAALWENATCLDLFEYQGIQYDDGFTDWRENLQDGKKVVYPEDGRWINGLEGDCQHSGQAAEDIIILRRIIVNCGKAKELGMKCNREFYLLSLTRITTHEFGHWLWLGHQDTGVPAIMSASFDNSYAAWSPQKSEVDILCDIYGCPADCPGRPR
jgi:hypothetical protein